MSLMANSAQRLISAITGDAAYPEKENMEQNIEKMTFEQALQELELTVTSLEGGDLALVEALALFERGQLLAAHCSNQLESAALRVEMLTSDGEIVELQDD